MIFNYIRFENYRPYYGIQQINLYSHDHESSPYRKNITLVGGLNGAGKTSLINSFFICFYGQRMFSRDEYENMKKEAINRRHLREGGSSSRIELAFTDQTGQYIIEVKFLLNSKREVEEQRKIYVLSGDNRREVVSAEEEFNDFIDQRIPIDVAPFFIFDAEKIRELVGEHDRQETIRAIQKIVSLELYKQLLDDLIKIKTNDEIQISKVANNEALKNLAQEIRERAAELEMERMQLKPDEAKIEALRQEKIVLEQKRRIKLANNSQTKVQISRRIGEIENELQRIQRTLEGYGRSSLPNLIIAPLVAQLQNRIKKEQHYVMSMRRENEMFAPYDQFMRELLRIPITPKLTEDQKQQLVTKGKDVWARINRVRHEAVEQIDVLHYNDLSQNELQNILGWKVSNAVDLKDMINRRIKLTAELKSLNDQLNDAPDVIDTSEEDERIAEVLEQLGALSAALKARKDKIAWLEHRHYQITNEYTRKNEAKAKLGPIEQKLDLINRLIDATKEFIEKATVLKARQLKTQIENILLRLFRKSDLSRVEFNPETFVLKIYDHYDQEIDLNSRSEGEKQLIALSMIWALTKVSGTDFPFVIDTPLARLDSVHRSRLVDYFFPNLSDQVIILTTDTEITKEFLEDIKPYIQFSYLLEYSDEEDASTIREGYFTFE